MKRTVLEIDPNYHMKRLIGYLQTIRKNDEHLDRLLKKVLKEAEFEEEVRDSEALDDGV